MFTFREFSGNNMQSLEITCRAELYGLIALRSHVLIRFITQSNDNLSVELVKGGWPVMSPVRCCCSMSLIQVLCKCDRSCSPCCISSVVR